MKVWLGIGVILLALAPSSAPAQAQITRVSTANLQVVAGGPAVPLTIEGFNLTSISSVSLSKSGQPVSTVSGTLKRTALQPTVGVTSLSLDIIAAPSAPAGTYQLELMFGAQRLVAPVAVIVASSQLPTAQGPTVIGTVTVPSTTVSSVNPATLKLVIGGPTQKVLLNGALLDKIMEARVEKNGLAVNYIQEAVLTSTGSTQREISLTALSAAQPSTAVDLTVKVFDGSTAGARYIKVPLLLSVAAQSVVVHRDQLFGVALSAVLQGATTSFTSCGTPSQHVFAVSLPKAPYAVNGTVPRLEHQTSVQERVDFLVTHSIKPSDPFNPSSYASFTKTAHPSPFPHSVAAVRTCLETFSTSNWTFAGATEAAGAAHVVVSVRFPTAVFSARGMPADPTGAITALNFGVGWGDPITDNELPDFTYAMPTYEVRLPLTLSSGKISYGPAQSTLKQQGTGWSSQFLGPGGLRSQLEQYAAARMTQIGTEIRKAFDAANTKTAITNQIANWLQANYGISSVIGVSLSKGDMWEVQSK